MRAIGLFLAVTFHLGMILFGGVFLFNDKEKAAREEEVQEMEIEEEKPEEKQEEVKPDDVAEEVEKEEAPPQGPALAPSMADLEVLLGGGGGDSAFGVGGALNSGGGPGGGDGPGGADAGGVLSSSQLDEKPRLVKRIDPKPPTALAKTLPQITVTVFIDAAGNVMKADVVPAVDPGAMKPIMDAVMRWKYEPGMRNGQKVGCKVSHKINFQ